MANAPVPAALKDKLARRFGTAPGFRSWLAHHGEGVPAAPAPRLWEAVIVYRDGRDDVVLTPPGGVSEAEATSVYRTYRETVSRAEGVVGIFPVTEA